MISNHEKGIKNYATIKVMDMRIIDLIRDMKKLLEEQSKRMNEIDNRLSSDIKKLEERIVLLENRVENYRFSVEKRYIPALVERIGDVEKKIRKAEERIGSFRVEWSGFRDRFEARMREMETFAKSQQDYEVLMRKIKGIDDIKE